MVVLEEIVKVGVNVEVNIKEIPTEGWSREPE